jgi:hypothetical protein
MESQNLLTRRFAEIGARLTCRTRPPVRVGPTPFTDFRMDIASDRRGEHFDLVVADPSLEFTVVDVQPQDRHLLLLVRDPVGAPDRTWRLLCGHDERHWFVARTREGSNVVQAKESLKPAEVRGAEERARVPRRARHRRRNAAFVRQGEWFFVPAPDLQPDPLLILHREPLRRGGGRPHIAEFAYRRGGTQVYVCDRYPSGLTEKERASLIRERPAAAHLPWHVGFAGATVFVKGRVRHPDHRTVVLRTWHRVLVSDEFTGSTQIRFVD